MWGLRVVTSDGVEPVAWPEDTPDAWLGAGTASELAFHRTGRGNASLMEVRGLAQVEDASLDGTTLTVRGSWLGVPLDGWSLVLQGPRTRMPGKLAGQDDRGQVHGAGAARSGTSGDWDRPASPSAPIASW